MSHVCPKLRIEAAVAIAGICLNFTACSNGGLGGNPASPSGPPAAGSTINYSAIGASDADGIGSSQPCLAPCSNGTGYVFVTQRALQANGFKVNLTLLAVPTSTIGPDFASLGNKYGHLVINNSNLIEEAEFVTNDASIVTVFAGGNDVEVVMSALGGGAAAGNQTAYIDGQIATFAADYATLLSTVRARSRSAHIIAINLPNFAGIPMHAGDPLPNRQAVQRLSVGMTREIDKLTSQGVTVVDLMCDPRFYQSANFSSDGFHPNDRGYATLSSLVVQAVTASSYAAPPSSCAQMSLVP